MGALALIAVVVRGGLLLATDPGVRAALGIGLPTCQAARISTPQGREGVCADNQTLFGGGTTFNVVDADRQLTIPDYDARLLRIQVSPTHVSNWQSHPDVYPGGRGLLVSFLIVVTNTSSTSLLFDSGGWEVDLLVDDLQGRGPVSFPDLPSATGAPGPPIGGQTIAPHRAAFGWLDFVAPPWIPSVLNVRASDLEFYRPEDASRRYVGDIRLWKVADPADAGVLRYLVPSTTGLITRDTPDAPTPKPRVSG